MEVGAGGAIAGRGFAAEGCDLFQLMGWRRRASVGSLCPEDRA